IFGIDGLFLSLLVSKNIKFPEESRKELLSSILLFISYNLFYGFVKEDIDNAAHIGGLLSGFILGFLYNPAIQNTKYSKFFTHGLVTLTLIAIWVAPKIISNPLGEFQNMMTEFAKNEDRALWMYKADLSYITPEKSQFYYNKFETEGTELWDK